MYTWVHSVFTLGDVLTENVLFVVATKVEFYVGDVPDGHTPSLQNARYTRLG